jgi:ABC-type transporter Mla MlaB component
LTVKNVMFRITVVDNPTEETWILQGQLTGEFASELSANWRQAQDRCYLRSRVVDLTDVTLIDKSGEEVLLEMIRQQAKFIAAGLYTRHLLEELQARIQREQGIQ